MSWFGFLEIPGKCFWVISNKFGFAWIWLRILEISSGHEKFLSYLQSVCHAGFAVNLLASYVIWIFNSNAVAMAVAIGLWNRFCEKPYFWISYMILRFYPWIYFNSHFWNKKSCQKFLGTKKSHFRSPIILNGCAAAIPKAWLLVKKVGQ